MSNNTTLNSELFQALLVQSQIALYENSIARAVSTVYDCSPGAGKQISIPVWNAVTASKPGEGVAPSAINTDTNSRTVDLVEHVAFAEVTDFLRDSAQESVITSLANQMGLALGESLDKDLIALFSNVAITQEVGDLTEIMTVNTLMRAAARIRANKYQGPLFAVVNPLAAFQLKAAMTATNNFQNATNVGNAILDNFFVGSIAGITILEHPLVPVDGQGQTIGCVFSPAAFATAQRGGVTMETERNAAKRSTDVVETLVAGVGIIRPEQAVKIKASANDPVAPSNND